MAENETKGTFWKNHPILEKVVGGLILAAILSLIVYLIPNGWQTVFGAVKSVVVWGWHVLTYPVTMPFWVFAPICLLAIIAVVVILRSIRAVFLPEQQQTTRQIHWEAYNHDRFFEAIWMWSYPLEKQTLIPLCPVKGCECRLDAIPDYARMQVYHAPIRLECPRCGYLKRFDWEKDELYRRVILEIDRLVRSGDYAERLKVQASEVKNHT